jgi:hypothetical protein
MINLFWENALKGINPYTPHGGSNIPSPFPFYFIIAFPFHLCREVDILSLLGAVIFIGLLYKSPSSLQTKSVGLMALLLSPAFCYEVVCRSTVFLNSVLVILLVAYLEKKRPVDSIQLLGAGILTGLALSTRSVVVLMLIPYWMQYFRREKPPVTGAIVYLTATAAVFLILFVPFLSFPSFLAGRNPFAVQAWLASAIMPIPAIRVALTITIAAGFFIRDVVDYYYFEAAFLSLLTLGFVAALIAIHGWKVAIVESRADISYLLFFLPFMIIAMWGQESPNVGKATSPG